MHQFILSVGEPWDFEGPDGQNRVLVDVQGIVKGPKEENLTPRHLLLRVKNPFDMDGEKVKLLVASPRYKNDTIEELQSAGGTVGCARVRPGFVLFPDGSFAKESVVYCIIGGLTPNVI